MVRELRDRLTGHGAWVVRAPQFDLAYTAGLTARGLPELLLLGASDPHVAMLTAMADHYATVEPRPDPASGLVPPPHTPHRWRMCAYDPVVHPDLPVARGLFGEEVSVTVVDVRSCHCDAPAPPAEVTPDPVPRTGKAGRVVPRIDPTDPVVQYLFTIIDIIDASGWAVQFQGAPGSMLAYTVGLSERHWPELVTIGLDPQEAALVLNAVGQRCVEVAGEPRHGMEMVVPQWNHRAVRLEHYAMPAHSLTIARSLYSAPPYTLRALEVRHLD